MTISRCIVKRPSVNSTLRIHHAPGYEMRVLACEWPDLADLRAYLKVQACAGTYVLTGLDGLRPVAYVGEGSRLWDRLADHRSIPPLPLVQTAHLVCSPNDYDKGAVVYLQAMLSDRLRECGRLERIGAEPARLSLPADRLEELQRQVEPALALLAMAGCSAVIPGRSCGAISEGDLA